MGISPREVDLVKAPIGRKKVPLQRFKNSGFDIDSCGEKMI